MTEVPGMTIPVEQLTQLVMRALDAAAAGDVAAAADATEPVANGTVADGWMFLCGVLGSTERMLGGHDARHTALRFARVDDAGGLQVTEPDETPAELVAYGRLLTAYLNRDGVTAAALWEAAIRAGTAWPVICLALFQAGQMIRAGL